MGEQAVSDQMISESESTGLQTPDSSPDGGSLLQPPSSNSSDGSEGPTTENGDAAVDFPGRLFRASASSSRLPFHRRLLAEIPPEPGRTLQQPPLTASFSPTTQTEGISIPSLSGPPLSGSLSASALLPAEAQVATVPFSRATSAIPLVITPGPQEDNEYSSIGEALAANPEATLIELRYSGRGFEEPIIVTDRQLTIRAGSGHAPVLAFEPTGTDPVLCPRDMIQVSDGKLVLESIDVEMEIPRDMPSESWALVRLSAGGRVRLENCSLRVRNASDTLGSHYQDVAFFRATPQETRVAPSSDPFRPEGEPDIELLDCIACGEADLVRASESTSLRVEWRNGLLVTTEAAFSISGSSRAPSPGAKMDIEWEHVTAVTGDSLVNVILAPHRPHLAQIHFSESACVLSSRNRPLIRASGVTTSADQWLIWASEFPVIQESLPSLSMTDASGSAMQDDKLMESLKAAGFLEPSRLVWQDATSNLAVSDRPMHSMGPSDFRLNLTESEIPDEAAPAPGFLADPTPGPPTAESVSSD